METSPLPSHTPPIDHGFIQALYNGFLWNPSEHRLRTFWRLILQIFLYVLLSIIVAVGLSLVSPLIDPRFLSTIPQNSTAYLIISTLSPILTLLGITVSVWVTGKWIDHRKFSDFGLHFNHQFLKDICFGLGLGAILMTGIFLIELAAGWIQITGTYQTTLKGIPFMLGLIQTIILFVCVGIFEELFSRGYQLRNLAEGLNYHYLGSQWALIGGWSLSSLIFGLLHAANPNASIISTVNIVIAGLFLGLGYILTGELAIPIGIHITWNFFQGNVYGFPVSGTTPIVTFISIQQGGPEILTGAAFGPEAGILGLLAMVIGSMMTILWVWKNYRQVKFKESLASYQNKNSGD
jgi:membrane protease YdiL (CAAX protease family)